MPSTMQWWILDKMAQRPPSSPSSSHSSQSGRCRSSGSANSFAAVAPSCSGPPGARTEACRTWCRIANSWSSAQTGRSSWKGVARTTWRYRGTRGSFASKSRMSSARVGAGPSNTATDPMCMGTLWCSA